MSGILERIEAKLDALNARIGQPAPAPSQVAQLAAPAPAADPFAVAAAPATAVTSDMLVALITPLVADPARKAMLVAEMNAMGINSLPDAQPHQYAELYQRFQRIAGAVAAQPAAAPASII